MIGSILSVLSPIIGTAVKRVLPEDPQKAAELETAIKLAMMESQDEIAKAQAEIVKAEAKGESWLQRNWRPIMMLWFGGLVGGYWFGFTPPNLSSTAVDGLFTLVQIGIGGYVIGRSGEKIAPAIADAVKNRKGK